MKYYKCMQTQGIVSEKQLRNLYYVKVRLGYSRTYAEWISEELMSRKLRYLNEKELVNEHISRYSRGK